MSRGCRTFSETPSEIEFFFIIRKSIAFYEKGSEHTLALLNVTSKTKSLKNGLCKCIT